MGKDLMRWVVYSIFGGTTNILDSGASERACGRELSIPKRFGGCINNFLASRGILQNLHKQIPQDVNFNG